MLYMKWLPMVILLARSDTTTSAATTKVICNKENQNLCDPEPQEGTATSTSGVDHPSQSTAEESYTENGVDSTNDQDFEDNDDDEYEYYYYEDNEEEDEDDEDDEEEYDWDQYDACRHHPTWTGPGVDFDTCRELLGYHPRDKWWRRDTDFTTLQTGEGTMELLRECLNQALEAEDAPRDMNTEDIEAFITYHHEEEGDVAIVRNILSEQEAYAITALQQCVNATLGHDSNFHTESVFNTDDHQDEGLYGGFGENYCTFLGGLLQTFLPGVAASVYDAAIAAYDYSGWEQKEGKPHPYPETLGIRTAEVLEYSQYGRLGTHGNEDSVFTIVINLSEPDDYNNGDSVHLDTEKALFTVDRLSGIVFFSESYHGLTNIVQGHRRVFAVELWDQDDAPIGFPRPQKEGMMDYMEDRGPLISEKIARI